MSSIGCGGPEPSAAVLERLKDPREVTALGLVCDQLLAAWIPARSPGALSSNERGPDRNLVRIHADSLDQRSTSIPVRS